MIDLRNGDCLEVLKNLEDNSVDVILCDPPYELTQVKNNKPSKEVDGNKGFMGKEWDGTGIAFSVELWSEALRVLKPNSYLMAFSGTRTYHRMAKAIEEAGFEIIGLSNYIYGSGFPKALDISKKIDQKLGQEREIVGERKLNERVKNIAQEGGTLNSIFNITAPSSDLAKQYEGYKTQLKPAKEPIIIARKKSDKTEEIKEFKPFIYCAKASKKDRNSDIYGNQIDGIPKQKIFNGKSDKPSTDIKDVEKRFTTQPSVNNHPTVKSTNLMQNLFKEVVPNDDITILDMFAGSGSTGVAIEKYNIENRTNHKCILIEREKEYAEIIKKRCCLEEVK